jgi:4-amino-4-deoxy-L-arabinose transferase-like glycosyltransferase
MDSSRSLEPVRPVRTPALDVWPLLSVAVLILGIGLRLFHLADKSLDIDEVRSVLFVRLAWDVLVRLLAQVEGYMTLYYLLLRVWLGFGSGEWVVRALSVLSAAATFPVIYALGARLFGARAGVFSALLLAVNPLHIRFSQTARSYTLVVFLATLSSLYFVEIIQRPRRWSWVAYVASSVLALYAHPFAGLVLVSQWASLLFLRKARPPWKGLGASVGVIGLLAMPMGAFLLAGDRGPLTWITKPGVSDLIKTFQAMVGGQRLLLPAAFILCLIPLADTVRRWLSPKWGGDAWPGAFLLLWLFVPVAVSFAASYIVMPVFQTSYLLISLPPLLLLIAQGIAWLPWRPAAVVILLMIAALNANTLARDYRTPREDWRSATHLILSDARPADAILFYIGDARFGFDYYVERFDRRWHPPVVFPSSDYLAVERAASEYVITRPAAAAQQALLADIITDLPRRYARVWLVLSHEDLPAQPLLQETSRVVQTGLAKNYRLTTFHQFRAVRVLLFERRQTT